jgi:hypothetical protein
LTTLYTLSLLQVLRARRLGIELVWSREIISS